MTGFTWLDGDDLKSILQRTCDHWTKHTKLVSYKFELSLAWSYPYASYLFDQMHLCYMYRAHVEQVAINVDCLED